MAWKVKIYLSKDKEDWLYLIDENTLEPKVFDDWPDAQLAAHLWSYSDIEEVRGEDKMGWHYQARKKIYGEEVHYELVEAYPDLQRGGYVPHTQNAATISADSKEELVKWLRRAADDVEKYDVIDDDK